MFGPEIQAKRGKMILYKLVAICVILAMAVSVFVTVRDVLAYGQIGWARASFWLTVAFILLIEAGVRVRGGSQHDRLFWVHMACSLPFFGSILALNFDTNPTLAYVCAGAFVGTVATGIPMLIRI